MKELSVYIRPLRMEDAAISFHWRNNPKIWRFTGSRPDRLITQEIEEAWLAQVLQRVDEKRFAICLKDSDLYIGNIFLTGIDNGTAYIHIFIGDIANWGKRRAVEAMALMLEYAFAELKLQKVFGLIDKKNVSSTALARTFHYIPIEEFNEVRTGREMMKWVFDKNLFDQAIHWQVLAEQSITKSS